MKKNSKRKFLMPAVFAVTFMFVYAAISGMITSDERIFSETNDTTGTCSIETVQASVQYVSVKKAAKQIRKNMINHTSSITVHFRSTGSDIEEVADKLFRKVYKVTANSSAGDYLRWKVKSRSITGQCSGTAKKNGKKIYLYDINVKVTYLMTADQEQSVENKVEEVLSELDIDDLSEYEKVKAIYEYICENVSYDYSESGDKSYTAYGALIEGKAVCQGYATLMYKMLKESGIEVRLIAGTADGSSSGRHGWNIVKIGDYYYNVDSTWDSERVHNGKEEKYFLLGGDAFEDHTRYSEYETDSFYSSYPMAAKDYGEGEKGYSANSITGILHCTKPRITKITKNKIKVRRVSAAGRYRFILYYKDGTKRVVNSRSNILKVKTKKLKKVGVVMWKKVNGIKVISRKTIKKI